MTTPSNSSPCTGGCRCRCANASSSADSALAASAALARAKPSDFCLPAGYVPQPKNLTLDSNRDDEGYWQEWRVDRSGMYQWHIYTLAASLIKERGAKVVVDVGCGTGVKLASMIAPLGVRVIGVDQASAVKMARERVPGGVFIEADLESTGWSRDVLAASGGEIDLIICADVLEHLVDPRPALAEIAACASGEHAGGGAAVVLSTPERRRLRGRACNRADKPEHVREWARGEFTRFIASQGFSVDRSSLYPQDDSPVRGALVGELLWRARLRSTSRLACHAVVCRAA